MLSIGELAKRTGVKVPTIRYYEQKGLLEPPGRSEGNQRRYRARDLKRLAFIRHARDLGFSINDIKQLLDLSQHPYKPCQDAHSIAVRHLHHIQERIVKLRRLETELKRLAKCDAGQIETCAVIETLADHGLCETEH